MPKSAVGTAKKSDPPMLRIEVWSLEQVDQKPTVRYQSRLKYPSLMRQRGIEGNVTVEVLVDPFGEVLDATAVDFTRDDFVQAALASVSRWRFRPGKRDGRPVHVRFQIPIEFSLR
jgi:protein TonB